MEIKIIRIANNNETGNAKTLRVDTLLAGFDNKDRNLDLWTKKYES